MIVRRVAGQPPEIFIIQPKPKHSGEVPPWVLPRGSRQYWEWQGDGRVYTDIRDAATAVAHAEQLESFTRTLRREMEEEAGIAPEVLERIPVLELGAMDFTSRTKGIYPIQWFLLQPDEACQAMMANHPPVDTLQTRWAAVEQIEAMIAAGEFSAGYLPVIAHALTMVE